MSEHSFTLLIDGDVDAAIDTLFEAGCDDATFGQVDGIDFADFDREAPELLDAIRTAIADIESVPGLKVRRVEPDDLVNMSDIAERLGRTPQSVRLLVSGERGKGHFPAPVSHLQSRHRLWRWSDVAAWAGTLSAKDEARARLIAALNAGLELRDQTPRLGEEERSLVNSLRAS
jgi:hypothetical protein